MIRKIRVLVLEDDSALQRTYKRMLSPRYDVEVVDSPAAATRFLDSQPRWLPDIVFTDWDMPGGNGGDFCIAFRQRRHCERTPVIVVSGLDRTSELERIGATLSLSKPTPEEDLIGCIDEYVSLGKHLLTLPDDVRMKRALALTRKELLSLDVFDLLNIPEAGEFHTAFRQHVDVLFPEINEHVTRFYAAFEADQKKDVPDLVAALAGEPPLVIVYVWSHLTAAGVEHINRSKWIHRNLVETTLRVFGVSAGVPLNMAVPGLFKAPPSKVTS